MNKVQGQAHNDVGETAVTGSALSCGSEPVRRSRLSLRSQPPSWADEGEGSSRRALASLSLPSLGDAK